MHPLNLSAAASRSAGAVGRGFITLEPASIFGRPYQYPNTGEGAYGPRKPGVPHGGGCCLFWDARLPWPDRHVAAGYRDGTAVQLGILHYKLARYQYVQQLYAFEATPPFGLVGLSDPFCWADPTSVLTPQTRLTRRGRAYPCAYIQMTMSLTAHASDARAAVVGVGMNDCSSRVALTITLTLTITITITITQVGVGMNDCSSRVALVPSVPRLVQHVTRQDAP